VVALYPAKIDILSVFQAWNKVWHHQRRSGDRKEVDGHL